MRTLVVVADLTQQASLWLTHNHLEISDLPTTLSGQLRILDHSDGGDRTGVLQGRNAMGDQLQRTTQRLRSTWLPRCRRISSD